MFVFMNNFITLKSLTLYFLQMFLEYNTYTILYIKYIGNKTVLYISIIKHLKIIYTRLFVCIGIIHF